MLALVPVVSQVTTCIYVVHTVCVCIIIATSPFNSTPRFHPCPRYAIPASNYDRYNSQGYAAQGQQYSYAQYAT